MDNKMKIFSLLPALIFTVLACTGQQPNIDSLRNKKISYPVSAEPGLQDTVLLAVISNLCNAYHQSGEPDSILPLTQEALMLADKIKTGSDTVAGKVLEKHKMMLYRFKGIYYFQSGDYVNSFKVMLEYLRKAELLGSVMDIGNAYNYLAYCHRELEDYDQSLEFARKGKSILEKTEFKSALANSYTVYGTYFQNKGIHLDSAIYYMRKAFALYMEDGNVAGANNTTFDLAEIFYNYGRPDSSAAYLEKIRSFVIDGGNPFQLARYRVMAGRLEYLNGNNNKALENLQAAKSFADESGNAMVAFNVNKYLALALAADHRYKKSLETMNATMDAYSQDINTEKARELNTTKLNFEFEREKQKQQFEFEKKQALAELEIKRQRVIKNLSLLGVILGGVIAVLLLSLYRQSKRSEKTLKEKNDQVESSYRELQEMQEQLVITEKQREAQNIRVRIARDIHDELGAGLTRITLLSDMARRKLQAGDREIDATLNRVIENSKGVSSSLNEIVWAVSPSNDTLDVLVAYMKKYANDFLEDTGIRYELTFSEVTEVIYVNPELKRNIFLVMKEALNNAVKYSQADLIEVDFSVEDGNFILNITDNGKGFDTENVVPSGSGGNGMPNMKFRMEQAGCSIHVRSSPANGCTIEASGRL